MSSERPWTGNIPNPFTAENDRATLTYDKLWKKFSPETLEHYEIASAVLTIDRAEDRPTPADEIDGAPHTVLIENPLGPLAKGRFTSKEDGLTFQLGKDKHGSGTLKISKIEEGYVSGRFDFVMSYRGERGEKNNHVITDGRFRAKVIPPLKIK